MNNHRDNDLYNDLLAQKVKRFLLIFQICAVFLGLFFIVIRLTGIALFLTFVTLVLILGVILWAYIRYKTYPIVQEKDRISKKARDLQNQIIMNAGHIQKARQNREDLKSEEKVEMQGALTATQNEYIRSGMNTTRIEKADIPGIGPSLKKRLAIHGFCTAARITSHVTAVEGFGPAKTQAIVDWRNHVYRELNRCKPTVLPIEKGKPISEKFETLHKRNTVIENNHLAQEIVLKNKLREIQPRILELGVISFKRYLRNALVTKGYGAGLVATGLIVMEVCLGTSATIGSVVASIPTSTSKPTLTISPTKTITSTLTYTSTTTDTPTITYTPTLTSTPSITNTPTLTFTPSKTATLTPGPYSTIIILGGLNGNPWGYKFEGSNYIFNPPNEICNYFRCIKYFWSGNGYLIECMDGMISKSGGIQGACSNHGGPSKPIYSP